MGRRKTVLHQAAKISGLEEQVQRKQRRGKAVDTVPPPPAQAGVGWGGPWGNVRSCPPAALSPYFASLRPAAASAPLRTRQAAAEARGRKKKWLYKGTKGGNRPRQLRGEGRVGGGSGSAYVPGATRNILSG